MVEILRFFRVDKDTSLKNLPNSKKFLYVKNFLKFIRSIVILKIEVF